MTLQTRLFDGLSDTFGTGSIEHMCLVGEDPPYVVRVTLKLGIFRRMFLATITEDEGDGEIEIVELDPNDDKKILGIRDEIGEVVAETIGNVLVASA